MKNFADNQKISGRQVFRLFTCELLGAGTLLLPPLLARTAGRDGIFAIGIGLVAALFYLKLLEFVMTDMGESRFSYLKQKFGKFLGNTVIGGYIFFFAGLSGYTAYRFADVVRTNLLKEEGFFSVLVPVCLVLAYTLWSGQESRARVYEILFWFLLVPLFLLLGSAVRDVQPDYWMPIFLTGQKGLLEGSFLAFTAFSVIGLLPFAEVHAMDKKEVVSAGRKALLFSGTIYGLLYLILLGIFGSNALSRMRYPVITMMSMVQLTGGFLKRTDALMFGIWFFTLFALLTGAAYYGGMALDEIFMPKKKRTAVLFTTSTFIIATLFYRNGEWCGIYEKLLLYIGIPFLVLIPCILATALLPEERRKRVHRVGAMALLLPVFLSITGCGQVGLEDRDFPIEIGILDTADFSLGWMEQEKDGGKIEDYSHLKVIFMEQDFLKNEKNKRKFLDFMETQDEVPRNCYVVTAKDVKKIMGGSGTSGEAAGAYLEKCFEKVTEIKKTAYPTLGMLYKEKENRLETLLIPEIIEKDGMLNVEKYLVQKRGRTAGELSSEAACLSFFTQNKLNRYGVATENGVYVELSDSHNEISFETGADGVRRIVADIRCNGEVVGGISPAEESAALNDVLSDYMNEMANKTLEEAGVDLTNSYKKLGGGERQWFLEYEGNDEKYEEDMDICYRLHVTWVNMT